MDPLRVIKTDSGPADRTKLYFNDPDKGFLFATKYATFPNGLTLFMNSGEYPLNAERPRDVWFLVDEAGWVVQPIAGRAFKLKL